MPGLSPTASSAASGCSSISRSLRSSQSAPPTPITGAIRRPVSGCSAWNAGAEHAPIKSMHGNTRPRNTRPRICLCVQYRIDCGMVIMSRLARLYLRLSLLAAMLLMTGCGTKQNSLRIDYPMGERVTLGPLTYNVIETAWRSQLGSDFKLRIPQQRYLMITISVTNGGGHEVSVPLLTLENQSGQTFLESDTGEGVDNWFGLLRTLSPAQT